jgi:hypothetical protein
MAARSISSSPSPSSLRPLLLLIPAGDAVALCCACVYVLFPDGARQQHPRHMGPLFQGRVVVRTMDDGARARDRVRRGRRYAVHGWTRALGGGCRAEAPSSKIVIAAEWLDQVGSGSGEVWRDNVIEDGEARPCSGGSYSHGFSRPLTTIRRASISEDLIHRERCWDAKS